MTTIGQDGGHARRLKAKECRPLGERALQRLERLTGLKEKLRMAGVGWRKKAGRDGQSLGSARRVSRTQRGKGREPKKKNTFILITLELIRNRLWVRRSALFSTASFMLFRNFKMICLCYCQHYWDYLMKTNLEMVSNSSRQRNEFIQNDNFFPKR